MPYELIQVDAFTDRPFAGNPAAICLREDPPELDGPRETAWMQHLAGEMNLSETAFLCRQGKVFQLRWFTPLQEVDLCGHATLAAAHVLWETGRLAATDPARFATRSGELTATRAGTWIALDFPASPLEVIPPPERLCGALGVAPRRVGRSAFDLLVELETPDELRSLQPDYRELQQVPTRGVIVTAPSDDPQFDFLSRFFAPRCGIEEDPVTGSAHCCLGPFWAQRLNKPEVVGYQASPRGGVVRVKPDGDRVLLSGQAVTVLRGHLSDIAHPLLR